VRAHDSRAAVISCPFPTTSSEPGANFPGSGVGISQNARDQMHRSVVAGSAVLAVNSPQVMLETKGNSDRTRRNPRQNKDMVNMVKKSRSPLTVLSRQNIIWTDDIFVEQSPTRLNLEKLDELLDCLPPSPIRSQFLIFET
jgi:hypothetical protein